MPTITDINAECRDLCDATTTSYPAASLLRRINEAYERIVAWILEADGFWQWDDTNYSDFPIGTQTLVESQNNYSFNDKFLEIEEVQVKNSDGDWQIIQPIDQKEWSKHIPLDEEFETDGMPEYYDKITDDTIALYPAPDDGTLVTLASGLKIKYRRTADVSKVGDNSNIPGFASPFHYVLAYMAAIPYCMKYKKDRVGLYEKRVEDYKKAIEALYARREQDKEKKMTFKQRAYK